MSDHLLQVINSTDTQKNNTIMTHDFFLVNIEQICILDRHSYFVSLFVLRQQKLLHTKPCLLCLSEQHVEGSVLLHYN